MSQVTIKRIDEIDYYKGPNAIKGIRFRSAAKELGVTAWGMNVLELEPNCVNYPEHDHVGDGQEEVYVVLRGSARLRAGEVDHRVEAGSLVRVAPGQKRLWITEGEGVTLLAIGATPGQAYQPRR
jgi:quercetin dioxygenase-like cupin family protein